MILITGGAGFIGSHLVESFLTEGDEEVVVLDDLTTGTLQNLPLGHERLRFVYGSILDTDKLAELTKGCKFVFHLAAAVGVHTILHDPVGSFKVNTLGTENVLQACLQEGTPVLTISTSEVYGKNTSDRLSEDSDRIYGCPTKTRWSYAEAKAIDEMTAAYYHSEYGLATYIVRPFNTVGPRQSSRYGMVLPNFVRQALEGNDLTVYGDGKQTRCFLSVNDLIKGLVMLPFFPEAAGLPINLGGSEEITMADLAERVIKLTGSRSDVRYVPYDQAYGKGFEDMQRRVPDTTRAFNLMKWQPTFSLDEIIKFTAGIQDEATA